MTDYHRKGNTSPCHNAIMLNSLLWIGARRCIVLITFNSVKICKFHEFVKINVFLTMNNIKWNVGLTHHDIWSRFTKDPNPFLIQ